jgi:hypothetical protein
LLSSAHREVDIADVIADGWVGQNLITRRRGCAVGACSDIVPTPGRRTIMRWIAIAAALLLAGAADAQTLYKCVAGNSTSYQQQPCPRTARLVRSIETTPEPPPTATQLAEQVRKARMDREESAFLSHLAGTDQTRAAYRLSRNRSSGYGSAGDRLSGSRSTNRVVAQGDGCTAAKTTRENELHAAGLGRTFELLSRLDDDVAHACKRR